MNSSGFFSLRLQWPASLIGQQGERLLLWLVEIFLKLYGRCVHVTQKHNLQKQISQRYCVWFLTVGFECDLEAQVLIGWTLWSPPPPPSPSLFKEEPITEVKTSGTAPPLGSLGSDWLFESFHRDCSTDNGSFRRAVSGGRCFGFRSFCDLAMYKHLMELSFTTTCKRLTAEPFKRFINTFSSTASKGR